eukprot:TRINITY_DN1358_c0_g1_i1.p1 TRINITY_DN1358_c0_g1~~TRINITY_DN1358_c0_g1_i1.p1  ORF type:complete len:119 (-),score=41.19 TRINITY_DN1358_c0_g1_i1:224-580(-)
MTKPSLPLDLRYVLYVEANSIRSAKQKDSPPTTTTTTTTTSAPDPDPQFTTRDMYGIQQIAQEQHLTQLLVGSLCPAIFGHELVKLAFLLGLLGGTPSDNSSSSSSSSSSGWTILLFG